MTNVKAGLKIALPGYDAQTAPDYDLSFSSNWPMLQVVKTFTHTVTSADTTTPDPAFGTGSNPPTATVTFYHNLRYYAFADVWQYSTDSRFSNPVAERLNSRNGYHLYFGKNSIKVPTAITGLGGHVFLSVGTVISVKLYTFDFTRAFSYAAVLPPVGQSAYDPHVGIKIVRQGRDINSKDLRNFIFHSRGSAPQILTVLTPENTNFVPSSTYTDEVINYQIPNGIPARVDFLYSTDTTDWSSAITGIYESSTGLAYYTNVYGQYDIQAEGDVSYSMTSSGYFTGLGLLTTVPFSVIVRRDPLLYSEPTVIKI